MGVSKLDEWRRRRVYHVECCSCGDNSVFILDVFDTGSWQANRDDSEESEDLSHESCDIWDLLFYEASFPGISIWVNFHDLFVSPLLNFLAVWRGEVGNSHDEVSWDGIEASGDHGQTYRFYFV